MDNFALIKKNILRTYPHLDFEFNMMALPDDRTTIKEFMRVTTLDFRFSVMFDSKWSDIHRVVRNRLERCSSKNDDCEICCEQKVSSVMCNVCGNDYCADCYIDLFESRSGIITCPFCRVKTGCLQDELGIEMGVVEICSKLLPGSIKRREVM